ncbi:uncharacterized protein JCM10292_007137 [Rhodotorula paludigena]|uniref:uncharacterized protein n=1 Tax=Rhodotorula paludigena TaxID=86838 RepID=UPI00317FFD7E
MEVEVPVAGPSSIPAPPPSAPPPAAGPSGLSAGIAARAQSALNRLNELIDAEEALVHNRAQKRSAAKQNAPAAGAGGETATRSCSACRRHKSKCVPSDVPDKCVRCIELGKACVYPGVRNRGAGKRLSKNHRALLSIKRDLEAVLAGDDGTDVLEGSSDGDDDGRSYAAGSIVGDDEADTQLLSNPLALLAHSSSESTSAASRSSTLQRSLIPNLTRGETNRAEEPVQAGLLTAADFKRLISLYFASLRPFMQLLDSRLHTPDWLRLNSPFLATCLAFVASTFDPLSAHQTESLKTHALQLATEIYNAGLKSLEILQGFYVLSHWSPPTADPSEERAWSWLWDAVRMATELRIDIPVEGSALDTYRWALPPTVKEYEMLVDNRKWTWAMLFNGRLAMSVQTGRFDCAGPPPILRGPHAPPPSFPSDHPTYSHIANLHVNTLQVRSLNLASQLSDERNKGGLREQFMSFWKPEMEAWRRRWPAINPFIDIHAENIVIMLNLVALRFPGDSPNAILNDCMAAAIRTIQKVVGWEDKMIQVLYSSNYMIWHIAYGAVLLLQLSLRFQKEISTDLRNRCLRVAVILDQIGRNRPNAASYATLHAKRIRVLCESTPAQTRAESPLPPILASDSYRPLDIPPQPPTWPIPPAPPVLPPPQTVANPPPQLSDAAELSTFPLTLPELDWDVSASGGMDFLDMSVQDPTLSWLWDATPLGMEPAGADSAEERIWVPPGAQDTGHDMHAPSSDLDFLNATLARHESQSIAQAPHTAETESANDSAALTPSTDVASSTSSPTSSAASAAQPDLSSFIATLQTTQRQANELGASSALNGSANETVDEADLDERALSEMLAKLDDAEGTAIDLEGRLDGLLSSLDQMLGALGAGELRRGGAGAKEEEKEATS